MKIFFRNNPIVIGQDNANVPSMIKIFADAFVKSSIEPNSPVGQRMSNIVRHVQVRLIFLQKKSFFNRFDSFT